MLKFGSGAMKVVMSAVTIGLLGYCVYFDYKRCHDVNYKKRVRERRMRSQLEMKQSPIPDFKDATERETYFIQEIQAGEADIGKGEVEKGVCHLAKALMVCGRSQEWLDLLQRTLHHEVFAMLILKIREYSQLMKKFGA